MKIHRLFLEFSSSRSQRNRAANPQSDRSRVSASRSAGLVVMLTLSLSLLVACGGGGGGGDGDVLFRGTITRATTTTTTGTSTVSSSTTTTLRTPPCPTTGQGIQICALGMCDYSSGGNEWSFSVGEFGGGDVDFFLKGCGVDAVVRLVDLSPNANRIEFDLTVQGRTSVVYSDLIQYADEDFQPEDFESDAVNDQASVDEAEELE